ncbi:hypothetical protein [Legionella spiritensis]|nr:hypothetical protein [Legionella spiritensis]
MAPFYQDIWNKIPVFLSQPLKPPFKEATQNFGMAASYGCF